MNIKLIDGHYYWVRFKNPNNENQQGLFIAKFCSVANRNHWHRDDTSGDFFSFDFAHDDIVYIDSAEAVEEIHKPEVVSK